MRSKLTRLVIGAMVAGAGLAAGIMRRRLRNRDKDLEPAVAPSVASPMARTSQREGLTRAELYDEAKRRGISGRSKMTKSELQAALSEGAWT